MTQSQAIRGMCVPSPSLSPPSCFFWHKLQPGKGGRIQRFPQGPCSDGPYKAGSSWSQGSSAVVLQPVQASKPTVRCLWPWNPLHFGALSQSERPEGKAHLLGRVGEDSSPFPPESECRPPTGRQRRHLSYKDALRSLTACVSSGPSLQFALEPSSLIRRLFCSFPCTGAELGQRVSPGSLC